MFISFFEESITNVTKLTNGWVYDFVNPGSVNIYDQNFELLISDYDENSYTYYYTDGFRPIGYIRDIYDYPPTIHIIDKTIDDSDRIDRIRNIKTYVNYVNVLDSDENEVIYHKFTDDRENSILINENNDEIPITINRIDNLCEKTRVKIPLYYQMEIDGIQSEKTQCGYVLRDYDNKYDYFEIISVDDGITIDQ